MIVGVAILDAASVDKSADGPAGDEVADMTGFVGCINLIGAAIVWDMGVISIWISFGLDPVLANMMYRSQMNKHRIAALMKNVTGSEKPSTMPGTSFSM